MNNLDDTVYVLKKINRVFQELVDIEKTENELHAALVELFDNRNIWIPIMNNLVEYLEALQDALGENDAAKR